MTGLRKELNEQKSANASQTKKLEEMNQARAVEASESKSKLQQSVNEKNTLKEQLSQELMHRRNIELAQTHYQVTIDSLNQQLEVAQVQAVSVSANNAHLISEMEQLRGQRNMLGLIHIQ